MVSVDAELACVGVYYASNFFDCKAPLNLPALQTLWQIQRNQQEPYELLVLSG